MKNLLHFIPEAIHSEFKGREIYNFNAFAGMHARSFFPVMTIRGSFTRANQRIRMNRHCTGPTLSAAFFNSKLPLNTNHQKTTPSIYSFLY